MHKNDTQNFSRWDVPLSLVLLTRLPIPALPNRVFARQAKAAWAFPFAGLAAGGLGCVVGWTTLSADLPVFACAVFVVVAMVAATGAMHEDGLADTVDGLWGGFTAERRLEIMKDSSIGTYGVLALVFSQLLRISAIAVLLSSGSLLGILAAAMFSRAVMPPLMRMLPNARGTGLSHRVGAPSLGSIYVGLGLAGLAAVILIGWAAIFPIAWTTLAAGLVAVVARTKIGGQTGDILGATQQVSEIVFLLAVAALV